MDKPAVHQIPSLINKYEEAVNAYEHGEPTMTDQEFDVIRQQLESVNVDLSKYHNSEEYGTTHPHKVPMVSLHSFHANESGITHLIDSFKDFFNNSLSNDDHFLAMWKYDGVAIEFQYESGALARILTRGNYYDGFEITSMFRHFVPERINNEVDFDLRCEVVIDRQTFDTKYAQNFANERNFVGGIVKRKNSDMSIVNDLHVIVHSIILHKMTEHVFVQSITGLDLSAYDNIHFGESELITFRSIEDTYADLLQQRSSYKYRTDGIVLRNISNNKVSIKQHIFLNALAIKFPAVVTTTTIIDIEWRAKLDGTAQPVGILNPVLLDGSTVSRVSLFNINYMAERGLFPGAEIHIIKSGDIIPHVKEVIKRVEIYSYNNPELEIHTNAAGRTTAIFKNDSHSKIKRFIDGVIVLGLDGFGPSIAYALYESGVEDIADLIEWGLANAFTAAKATDHFPGVDVAPTTLQRFVKSLQSRCQSIHLSHIIRAFRIPQVGARLSHTAAQYYSRDYTYSAKNINKDAWSLITQNKKIPDLLQRFPDQIVTPSQLEIAASAASQTAPGDIISYEMTGSPRSAGFATKGAFLAILPSTYKQVALNKASLLITDNIESNSTKMQWARSNNVQIKTYDEITKIVTQQ